MAGASFEDSSAADDLQCGLAVRGPRAAGRGSAAEYIIRVLMYIFCRAYQIESWPHFLRCRMQHGLVLGWVDIGWLYCIC